MRSLNFPFGPYAFRRLRAPGLLVVLVLAALPAAAQPFPANMCAADRRGSDLGCTSNDVDIAAVSVNNGVTSCVAGTQVTLDLNLTVLVNANRRYDVGIFVARDGQSPIIRANEGGSEDCAVFGLPRSPPPLTDLDGNACGDVDGTGLTSVPIGAVTVPCTPEASGRLLLPAVVTWDNNSTSTSCQAPPGEWVQASTKSNCSAGVAARIPVTVTGSLTIVKDTIPDGSPGSFAFNATGANVAPASFSLADGQRQVLDTGDLTAQSRIYTVTEQATVGSALSSIECISDFDDQVHPEFVSVDVATRTATISMSANGTVGLAAVTCRFGNSRQASITVVKNTVGGDTRFPFNGPSPFAITTVDGTGRREFPDLAPGTYTVSEIVPPGWALSGLACVDPTNDTSVLGATATIELAAGEGVTCTWTDTALGRIEVSKRTIGGDDTFTFGGPENFQITTNAGAGGPVAFAGLEPGVYAITEAVLADWQLSGIECSDPSGGTTIADRTATIDVAPGELVACTFTNTRQASVTVEKQSIGGNRTFEFGGTRPFSITTTGGNGVDTTTFASVAPGVALSIVESVPPGWSLTSAECRDTASGALVGSPAVNGVVVTPAAGQAITCTFVDTQGATLRVFKNAVPKGPQVFPFTITGPTASAFALVDDGIGGNSASFTDLEAGDYTVTEAPVAGWVNTGITCSDIVEPDLARRTRIDRSAGSVTANLRFGQTVECTFTNTQVQPGSITINKQAIGGNGVFTFTGSGPGLLTSFAITTSGADNSGSQAFSGLAAGTYTVAETVPAGWDLAPEPVNCTITSGSNTTISADGSNGVTIRLGTTGAATDSVACEFVNIKRGSITVTKRASPQDPQPFTFTTANLANATSLPPSFQLADGSTLLPSSASFEALAPTIYTITELAVPGWRVTDIACTGGAVIAADPAEGVAVINLQPGEDVACTWSNGRNGSITVTKVAQGNSTGQAFTFTGDLEGTINAGQSLSGNFVEGTYRVSEIVPEGWELIDIACTGGTVTYTGAGGSNPTPAFAPGDTTINVATPEGAAIACTFTNARKGSIRVVKNAFGDDASFDFTGARDFQVATNGGSGENTTAFESIAPGTYAITESIPPGWRLSGLSCTNGSSVDIATATANVRVAAGEAVTCTFNNSREGSITITKRIRSAQTATFGFSVAAALAPGGTFTLAPPPKSSASRVFENVLPGSYTISESTLPAGWTLTGITCTGASTSVDLPSRSATINLAVGDAAECIFDDSVVGSVTVSALSIGGTGNFEFSGFRQDTDGEIPFVVATEADTEKASVVFSTVAPGLVSAVAFGAPGWQLADVSCFGNSPQISWIVTGSVVLIAVSDGDVIECVFYYEPGSSGGGEPSFTGTARIPTLNHAMWLVLILGVLCVAGIFAARAIPVRLSRKR